MSWSRRAVTSWAAVAVVFWATALAWRPAYRPLDVAITPITSTSGGASGFAYGGESYEVACAVSGEVTLYPAVYEAVRLHVASLSNGFTVFVN